jgi:hypothetical protein
MIFQNVTHDRSELPSGFSTRWQAIGMGNCREMSTLEKKAMPGRLGDAHTQPPSKGREPNASEGNRGALGRSHTLR